MLGNFHTTKNGHDCVGRYLESSRADHVFIETKTFGVNVTEQILKGNHYYRCVTAFSALAEALQRLQIEAFTEHIKEILERKYQSDFIDIEVLIDIFNEKKLPRKSWSNTKYF